MPAGKYGAFQNAVDGYIGNIRDVVEELNNFGNNALEVVVGGTTDGADLGISGTVVSSDGVQNWQFVADIEATLRGFVIGTDSDMGMMGYLCSIAIAISMIFFLISIIQLVTEDRFTPEFLVKFFAKFVIAFCVIVWSPKILAYMVDFGYALTKAIASGAKELMENTEGFNPTVLEALVKNHSIRHFKNVGWANWPRDGWSSVPAKDGATKMELWGVWEAFKYWLEGSTLGIIKFFSFLLNAVVMFIAISRIIELYVRGAFLPIAAALMSDDGWKGSGGRYFRKLMSLATQNAAVILVASVFGAMMQTALSSIFTTSILGKYKLVCDKGHLMTLEAVYKCKTCLDQIPAPIDVPVMKPMLLCMVLCAAGLSIMFKTIHIMDDIWGAR